MSEQFTPLSWDELLAGIPTVAENEAARQRRKETEQAEQAGESVTNNTPPKPDKGKSKASAPKKEKAKNAPPAPKQEKTKADPPAPKKEKPKAVPPAPKQEKSKAAPPAPKREKPKAAPPAPKQEKPKAAPPAPKQEKPKAAPPAPKQEKPKAAPPAPKQEKPKAESPAPKQEKPKAESPAPKQEKPKDAHHKSKKGKNKGSAPKQNSDKKDTSGKVDQQNKINLPPVPQPKIVDPVIDLPKVEATVSDTLVIDLPPVNQPTNDAPAIKIQVPKASAKPASARDTPQSGEQSRKRHKSHQAVQEEKRPVSSIVFCAVRRALLAILVLVGLSAVGLCLVLNLIFKGPSPTARDVLTMSLFEASGTKWVPGLFLDEKLVEQIRQGDSAQFTEDEAPSALTPIEINTDTALTANSDEWKDCPDGVRIERVNGDTYQAYVMLVRDPSRVYLATSTDRFSMDVPGTRITDQIEIEGAIAAVNAGAFYDNGTSDPSVGSVPQGLTISKGEVVWTSGNAPEKGFAGFNQDNVLVVADTMTPEEAEALGIRDGCCFGPVLIQNGAVKNEVYNATSGYNPRTAIGQRADGSVILLCIDGRQAQSVGGSYADIIDIMVEYGAVNACNLDGGSSTTMLYRDLTGRYGTAGKVHMINNYSLLQSQPRKMPTFIMVRPDGEE